MKRSLPSLIAGALLVLVLVLYMVTFTVRYSEVAVVRTFGKATAEDVKREAGLYWKWPWPIQRVSRYDNRIQISTTIGEETATKDGKMVILTTAIGWRIDDPYLFSIKCLDLKDGEVKIIDRVRNDQKTVIAQYDFANMVSIDPQELKYDEMEKKILAVVVDGAKELYGIKVESIGIEKLALPNKITEEVFEAMKKERQAVADRYTSEGDSTAKQTTDEAEGIAGTIMAFAERKAAEIVAEGRRREAEYNKILSQDEGLAMFLLEIENLAKSLKERTTLVLEANQQPFEQLRAAQGTNLAGPATRPAEVKPLSSATGTPLPEIVK